MRITEIYVEVGLKKSQNYQGCHNSVGLRAELEGEEDAAAKVKQLQEQAYKLLVKKYFSGEKVPVKAVPAPAQAGPAGAVQASATQGGTGEGVAGTDDTR